MLFGSNLGAAEDIATRIARDAGDRGYTARTARRPRRPCGELPTEGAVVVVTASYNGEPPDNAGRFCAWIDGADGVGGRGAAHRLRVRQPRLGPTYQAVPTRSTPGSRRRAATRIYPRGEGDARGDFDAQFEDWYGGLWDGLGAALGLDASTTAAAGAGPRLTVQLEQRRTASPVLQSYRGQAATVRVNRELTTPRRHPGRTLGAPPRDQLPAGTTYATGDHLGVLPRNPSPWSTGSSRASVSTGASS